MNKPNLLGVTLMTALFVSLLAATPFIVSAQASPVPSPCFYFTVNGQTVGPQYCNPKANDITVIFKHGPNCVLISPNGIAQACPKGANDIEVAWAMPSTAAPTIVSCQWTHNGVAFASCPIIVGSTGFIITNTPIVRVFWTHNGVKIGKAIRPPATPVPVNDVEFSLVSSRASP